MNPKLFQTSPSHPFETVVILTNVTKICIEFFCGAIVGVKIVLKGETRMNLKLLGMEPLLKLHLIYITCYLLPPQSVL